ncbi:MAG TPA: HAD family hydrolase [Fimbriimonadaceae bacterium]|nr:HAD family hydrolase [Fimbriimonadaceae bacterium]
MDAFRSVRAVFFDLDDTLCAYWEAAGIGLRTAFELCRPYGKTPEEMIGHWGVAFRRFCPSIKGSDWYAEYLKSGEPTRNELMRLTLLEAGIQNETLSSKLGDLYAQARDENLRLFPDAVETLQKLKERFPLGLMTNGPADIQRQEVQTLGLDRIVDHVFIEGEMGEGKPLPAVFRRAESAVGLPPNELLFVGNSYGHDILPAIEAGWRTIWIRRPSDVAPSAGDAKPEEKPDGKPDPDAVVSNLIAVRELVLGE